MRSKTPISRAASRNSLPSKAQATEPGPRAGLFAIYRPNSMRSLSNADLDDLGVRMPDFATGRGLRSADNQPFDACLPRVARAVRIAGLYDAQVFTRRWVIRDKDPALKALMRRLDRAHNSSETSAHALRDFKAALASRGLLPQLTEARTASRAVSHVRERSAP